MGKARYYLEKAIKINPKHPEVLNNLGKLEQYSFQVKDLFIPKNSFFLFNVNLLKYLSLNFTNFVILNN